MDPTINGLSQPNTAIGTMIGASGTQLVTNSHSSSRLKKPQIAGIPRDKLVK